MDVLLKEAEDYIIQCHEIFAADPQGDVNGNRIPAVAELGNVYSRWKSYQEESRQRNVLAERIQESRKEGLRLQMSGGSQLRKATLIASSQSADEETFLRMGAAAKRREELVRTIRHHEITMFSGWDEGATAPEQPLELTDAELDAQCMKKEEAVSAAPPAGRAPGTAGRPLQERESLEAAGNEDFAPQPGGAAPPCGN